MLRARIRQLLERVPRRPALILFLLPCAILLSLYVYPDTEDTEFRIQFPSYKPYNVVDGTVDGYLVWNPRCHMLDKDPFDPSIVKFVRKEKYERCATRPILSRVTRSENNSMHLTLDRVALAGYPDLDCCWAPVIRPRQDKPKKDFDSTITVKRCERFENETQLPDKVEVILVTCRAVTKNRKPGRILYENVHPVLNPWRVRSRLEQPSNLTTTLSRPLSVLVLGIDSVSRLNFLRTMPETDRYLRETGWHTLKGYNKMADNTFPNLMAILTGLSQREAYNRCKPTVAYSLDRCPFIWRRFRDAGYVTAYGEDETSLNTFNYLKVGFVEPPTDYYLRPYFLAAEKLLKVRKRFGLKYCTGPEISFERVMDYAETFAKTFLGIPYFGFFWTTSISHENMNSLSSIDGHFLSRLRRLEDGGVLNDTMIVFLSDHGMRWGSIRNTFVGWYEERLPFVHLWLPEWFRREEPKAYESLTSNEYRLTSPFDLHQTLRHVLALSSGVSSPTPQGCPDCQSLFTRVTTIRGCEEAGVAAHWCTCTAFQQMDTNGALVQDGLKAFFAHIESIVTGYRDKRGRRMCAKLALKKLHRVDRVLDFGNSSTVAYFYMIQTTPGDGKFEVTIRHHESDGSYSVTDDEVSRINPYASSAKCLDHGMKQYCHCLR